MAEIKRVPVVWAKKGVAQTPPTQGWLGVRASLVPASGTGLGGATQVPCLHPFPACSKSDPGEGLLAQDRPGQTHGR